MKFFRKIENKLCRQKLLRQMQQVHPGQPRQKSGNNPKASRVFRINGVSDPADVIKVVAGHWAEAGIEKMIPPEAQLLIKINLNSTNPYPASTSPEMLSAFLDFLQGRGYRQITVADCTTPQSLPTRRVARESGILDAIRGKASFLGFEEGKWRRVDGKGLYLKDVSLPEIALQAERIIGLANLKNHIWADFSISMKHGVGFMHPLERRALHDDKLREKAVEINLILPADLYMVDGRKAFILGGPDVGQAENTGVVLLGTNPYYVDLEAYKVLYNMKKEKRCLEKFTADPGEMAQFAHARRLGLGGKGGYETDCEDWN